MIMGKEWNKNVYIACSKKGKLVYFKCSNVNAYSFHGSESNKHNLFVIVKKQSSLDLHFQKATTKSICFAMTITKSNTAKRANTCNSLKTDSSPYFSECANTIHLCYLPSKVLRSKPTALVTLSKRKISFYMAHPLYLHTKIFREEPGEIQDPCTCANTFK